MCRNDRKAYPNRRRLPGFSKPISTAILRNMLDAAEMYNRYFMKHRKNDEVTNKATKYLVRGIRLGDGQL